MHGRAVVFGVCLLGLAGCEGTLRMASDEDDAGIVLIGPDGDVPDAPARGDTGGGVDSGGGSDAGGPPPVRDAGPPPRPDAGIPDYDVACPYGPPLDLPIAGCRPAPPPSTGDPYADCVTRINQLRCECQHLPPMTRWTDGEMCVDMQAAYDAMSGTAHSGFLGGICGGGSAQNECPRWGNWESVIGGCLQQMWDEGPGDFYGGHGHYLNMSSQSLSHVACGQGGGWFAQNFY